MANDLVRFNRAIRNLYTAVFERRETKSTNFVPIVADLHYTEIIKARTLNTLGMLIARDKPEAWLRLSDQLLDLGAMNNTYVDSALTSRTWKDDKATLWTASPTWATTPRIQQGVSLVNGEDDGAKAFQGISSGYYMISNASLPAALNFTVEFLIYIQDAPAGSWTAGGLATSGNTAGLLIDSNGTTIRLKAMPDNVLVGTLVEGVIYHCMYVRDARGNNRVYLDGIEIYNSAAVSTSTFGPIQWIIPAGHASFQFAMDEVALYRTALTATQCAEHYAAFSNAQQATGVSYAPIARYYEALTFSGSDSAVDSSMLLLSDKASYFSSVMDETKMWGVLRIRPNWAYTAVGDKVLVRWQDSANETVNLMYNATNDRWEINRKTAGAGTGAVISSTHSAWDYITLAFKLTATQISLSVNGGAWTDQANTNIPNLTALYFDLLMSGSTYMLWAAFGVGTLTDAGLAAVHAKGNADPDITDFGDAVANELSFLWHCRGTDHVPIGSWGESVYA